MRSLLLITGLTLSLGLAAQEPGPGRSALEAFNVGLDGLHAGFTQKVINPDGSLMETGEGEAWVQRPDRFRWDYQGEFPESIIADGESVWLYDQSLEQVTVKAQSGLLDDTPLMLLTNLEGLDEQFVVTELGTHDALHVLELNARNNEGEFERVLLGMGENGIELMVLEDAFGIRTEVRFSDIVRNPELAEGTFVFDAPPGVDVIGEPGAFEP